MMIVPGWIGSEPLIENWPTELKFGEPTRAPMMLRRTLVRASTIGAKAPPMMTATARSMTLPWAMKSRKPFSMREAFR